MDPRKTPIVLALVALAIAATAPQALAATPEVDWESLPAEATNTSGEAELVASLFSIKIPIKCSSTSSFSEATSTTTGSALYLLHGCTNSAKEKCTSLGEQTGTILIETPVTHLVYLDESHTKPGMLLTPSEHGFVWSINCPGMKLELQGAGLLGEITAPKCGETSEALTTMFSTVSGQQKYTQVEETGSAFSMTTFIGGGNTGPATASWTTTATFSQPFTLTCPEQE
jgi:hypothetical protein